MDVTLKYLNALLLQICYYCDLHVFFLNIKLNMGDPHWGSSTRQYGLLGIESVCLPTTSQSSSSISGMEIVDLLESLQLHNTTYAGLQQKPGPHSHHPAALFSGRHLFPPLVPWTLVLWYPGFWYWGTLVPWYPGTVVPWYWGTGCWGTHASVPLSSLSSLQCFVDAGVERSVYYSSQARDRVASLIQSSKEFAFVTSIRSELSYNQICHISQTIDC